MKKALACTMFLGMVFSQSAAADELVFHGGIGVIPVSSFTPATPPTPTNPDPDGVINRNIVRGVQPAGQIWVIDQLEAMVSANGRIIVNGKGLVLGGGDSAGRATGQAVLATLICQPAGPFTESRTSSSGVTLSPNGDFMINDTLSPLPPDVCTSPMLLIRNAVNLGWFAVGIFRSN